MRGDLLLRKGSWDATSDNKVIEPNLNRYSNNMNTGQIQRQIHHQTLTGQSLINRSAAFPMSFIDQSQATQYNQMMCGGPMNLGNQPQALLCLPNISLSGQTGFFPVG